MKPQEKFLFCKLLAGIAEFYGKPLSSNVLEIYWNVLENYTLDQIKRALNLHIINADNGQFMPKPADILRYLEMDHRMKALLAWDKVIAAMESKGVYASVMFDDPLINTILHQMGGWIALCLNREEKMPFFAREFQQRYRAYLIYPPPLAPSHLPGIHESQNRLHGFEEHIPKPIPFGDKEVKLLISHVNAEKSIEEDKKDE